MEYRIKAAFILNFAKFATWPDEDSDKADKHLILCVLGKNPFGSSLESIRGKKVREYTIEIVYEPNPEALRPCHILFISSQLEKNLPDILLRLHNQPVLTIGEAEHFAKSGGMINFVLKSGKVCFEINPSAIQPTSLKISSNLLKLATIVEPDGNKK